MITKIIHIDTKEPVTTVPLREYAAHQIVHLSYLYNMNCETKIQCILNEFKNSTEDLILLVVRFVLPENRPSWIRSKKYWEQYKEHNKNRWGFQIINPKLYGNAS
jgi:hypothetical protein